MHDAIAAVICLLTMSSLLHFACHSLEFKHCIEITALTLLSNSSSFAIWFMPDNRYILCKWWEQSSGHGVAPSVTVQHDKTIEDIVTVASVPLPRCASVYLVFQQFANCWTFSF